MVTRSIFNTVEFYVIAAFVAAAAIAAAAKPRAKGPARTFLVGGTLEVGCESAAAGIEMEVDGHARLRIRRVGLAGVGLDGAYSLAVAVAGFDVTIEERLVPGRRREAAAGSGEAVLDFLGRERYHFTYRSEASGTSCSFSLNIMPGNRLARSLEA